MKIMEILGYLMAISWDNNGMPYKNALLMMTYPTIAGFNDKKKGPGGHLRLAK